jgi:hypothetical protein
VSVYLMLKFSRAAFIWVIYTIIKYIYMCYAEFCWAWGLDKWNPDSATETVTCDICKQSKWHNHFLFHVFFLCVLTNVWLDQDESVRLWNVHTGICILIFAGAGGHRNEVLSVVSLDDVELCLHSCNRKILLCVQ